MTHRLPTFLVIGAMKAGTTSLYHDLSTHPEVFMSAEKEPDFFIEEKTWGRGLDWYARLFAGSGDRPAVGEASTSYAKCTEFGGVPERIHSVLPSVRLVYVLREPVERVRSMYVHRVLMGRETRSLDVAVTQDSMYVDASRYALQLRRFLEVFPREQVHVMVTERVRQNRTRELAALCTFLGIDPAFSFPESSSSYESASRRVDSALSRAVWRAPGYRFVRSLVPRAALTAVRDRLTAPMQPDQGRMSPDLRRALHEQLRPDVDDLRALLGDDLAEWDAGAGAR